MWDPDTYLTFADERARPFHELLARVPARHPRRVADLGCGPGTLTETLGRRWPEAALTAIDSAPEMVAQARARGLPAQLADLRQWQPDPDVDVLVSNATLHWVPEHPDLLTRWARALPPGAWLAVQVPGNFTAPSHVLPRELAATPEWRDELADVPLLPANASLDAAGYADLLTAAGCAVDAWETSYLQRLTGPDAVLEWISGSALRPVRARLSDARWADFRAALAPRLADAYPVRADGTTWFPFRRVFAVARTPS